MENDDMSFNFHIIDFSSDDVSVGDDYWDKEFILTFYGKTNDNKNIVVNITGFKPYFYMRLPGNCGTSFTKQFLKIISKFINNYKSGSKYIWNGNYCQEELTSQKAYNFYGLNYDELCEKTKEYKFAKISFNTYGEMKKCISAIKDFYNYNKKYSEDNKVAYIFNKGKPKLETIDQKIRSWFQQEHNCDCEANLYESKIHPALRFIHEKNIESCGWVTVTIPNKEYLVDFESKSFNVDIEVDKLPMKFINPSKSDNIASFITASFDIECDSSHGDFPNPIKDFKKVAIDIHESYFRTSQMGNSYDFKRKFIKKCLMDAFENGSDDVQSIYTQNGPYSDKSMEFIISKLTDQFLKDIDESKENSKTRDSIINKMTDLFNQFENTNREKIIIKGDPIIQIGTTFYRYGEIECFDRSIIVIGNDEKPEEKICDDIDGINVYECKSEKELLLKWKDLILYHNPDLITGYNIFGFDFDYINKRVEVLFQCSNKCKINKTYTNCAYNCPKNDFYRLGRLMRNRESDIITSMEQKIKTKQSQKYYNNYWEKKCQIQSKQLSSSGLGDNILKYISMDGRIIFDIQKEIQKNHALNSYKLDDVSAHFMKGRITDIGLMVDKELDYIITHMYTNTLGNLKKHDYITININTKYGQVKYENGKKFKILGLNHTSKTIGIEGRISVKEYEKDMISFEWSLSKDDVSPQQIFEFHKKGGSSGRAKIAKYCIMDCELCIHLLLQLDLIPNNIGMANVSSVPLSYIFLRGQGIKINSIITKECSKRNTRIPTLVNFNGSKMDDGFEGAIVLEPEPGIYLNDPVSVLDYASLYPSSIIEKNLSHETFIGTQDDIDDNPKKYKKILEKIPYYIIEYDDYISELKGKTIHKKKADTKTICYFAKQTEKKQGIIPIILETLLNERRNTRKRIKLTNDENKKKVLDGLQLAYKVTANSVYGQMGAKTSSIFFKKIAACTTSIGRQRIYDARDGVVEWAEAEGYNKPEVVYGDTDSVFVKFSRVHHETGKTLIGKEALQYCIDSGVKAGEWITKNKMNHPQDLEYEKTFYPFILISKKRYTGDKYELTADKPKERTSMGIVMKRRDNASIVKYVFGNVIEIIMNQKNIDLALQWLKITLQKIINGEMDESMFIISKSLRGYYKNPEGIAHKALADRMAERNPGNKPKPNDRIPYMYRTVDESPIYSRTLKNGTKKYKKRKILQGDRIEHPDYIKEKSLDIDYSFYISNQIMNPVKQVLDLEKDKDETQTLFDHFIKKD